jgi:histidyl-tRNA synthetase
MGDVVLGELLRERGKGAPAPAGLDAFLIAVGGDDVPHVLRLAHELRDGGAAVEYGLRHGPVRKQLELAAVRGAARAVILGPDERRDGVVVVRDLGTGAERRVGIGALATELRGDGRGAS